MSWQGIDVSGNNGSVEWTKVRGRGYKFAIVKATEGQNWRDPTFTKGRRNAIRHAGLIFGAYHFARPSAGSTDPTREADDFVRAAKDVGWNPKVDLPLVLDVEATTLSARQTLAWCDRFATQVRRKSGRGCILYTGEWFWVGKLGLRRAPKNARLLWFAAYTSRSNMKRLLARMLGYRPVLWQYTSSARVPGVQGDCDVSVVLISDQAFNKLRHQ